MLQVRASVPTVQLEGVDGPLTKNLPYEDLINLLSLLMSFFFSISFNKNFSKGSEIVEISNINRRFSFGIKSFANIDFEFEGEKTAFTNGILLLHSCD